MSHAQEKPFFDPPVNDGHASLTLTIVRERSNIARRERPDWMPA